jgi:hypothetical protein
MLASGLFAIAGGVGWIIAGILIIMAASFLKETGVEE